jgi:N-formylglutamate amidohydrolase
MPIPNAHDRRPKPTLEILEPSSLKTPLVVASPHSGSHYPKAFVANSCLDVDTLRKSEDCFVDELFSCAPDLGAPLLRALCPRAFLDVNREPYELDPSMFNDPLPDHVNSASPRVAAGLGTIARIVATRREIYRGKLSFADAEQRIRNVYRPYHSALRYLIGRASGQFGFCVLIDCHSMPSTGLPMNIGMNSKRIDVVLGDRAGLSCSGLLTDAVEGFLSNKGYRVIRNNPYAGGYTTEHYGDPANGIHAIQIEINRSIYMDEATLQRKPSFQQLQTDVRKMVEDISAFASYSCSDLTYQRQSAE